jgi:hypothetical protein
MANTIDQLIPDSYTALDQVSREITGLAASVTIDPRASSAAVGEAVRVPVVPAASAGYDVTATMDDIAAQYQTIPNVAIEISKVRGRKFSWTAEEGYGLDKGPGARTLQVNQIAQAMRALVNELESDLAALHVGFSRAAGAVGTAPFATNTAAVTATRKILVDNGASLADASLVLNTTAGADLRTLLNINSARMQADVGMGEQGVFWMGNELKVRESSQIKNSTAGTGSGITIATGGYAVGATTFAMKNATGTGTFAVGDVITIADDTNQYVVASVTQAGANPATGDTFTIAEPGLRKAIAGEKVVTIIAASARHMAFARSAIVLATRLPIQPPTGDKRIMREVLVDPRTGIAFELSVWPGNRMVTYEVAMAWGVKLIKPEHTALLIGPVGV